MRKPLLIYLLLSYVLNHNDENDKIEHPYDYNTEEPEDIFGTGDGQTDQENADVKRLFNY